MRYNKIFMAAVAVFSLALFFVGCVDNPVGNENNNTDPALTGTVSITGTASVGDTLTANTGALGGSGTISYQWLRDGSTAVGGNSRTYVVQSGDVGFTVRVRVTRVGSSGSVTSGPSGVVTVAGGGGAWLQAKSTIYNVQDGVVGSVFYEIEMNWINYKDDVNFENEYILKMPYNTVTTSSSNRITQTGFSNATGRTIRIGQNLEQVSRTTSDITMTIDYLTGETPSSVTRNRSESTSELQATYDLASGLTLQSINVSTSTTIRNNDPPVVGTSNSTISYRVQLQSDVGGTKTYRYSTIGDTSGSYTVYTIKDGVTLETKSYGSGGVLSYTLTNSFPDNAVIRSKLPKFTIVSNGQSFSSNVSVIGSQACEVISDSQDVLVLRIKTYNNNRVLTSQLDYRYERMTF